MARGTNNSLIPDSCTFLNPDIFISIKAKEIAEKLNAELDNRDPDMHEMYIYNDFFNYATLDLIDGQIGAINTQAKKKNWTEAFYLLEALTAFMNGPAEHWPMCDDGDRVEVTNAIYGALLVTTLRALVTEGKLDASHFPSLESFLKGASEWGRAMKGLSCDSDYDLVCQAIAWRLFRDKSAEDVAFETARIAEWLNSLSPTQRKQMERDVDDDDEAKGFWFEKGKKHDENMKDKAFTVSRTWKEYRDHLKSYPTLPLRGHPSWDLSKWPASAKQPFLFSTMDEEMGF